MAHFAQIDSGKVVSVIVVSNDDCGGGNFPESESIGQEFINSLGITGIWKQTSYSGSFRSKYAGIGDIYDEDADEFRSPSESE